jgi:hypothetical protein
MPGRFCDQRDLCSPDQGEGPRGFEFPPPRPDQALLGWRRGPGKNKSNDPAAVIHSEGSMDASDSTHNLDLSY